MPTHGGSRIVFLHVVTGAGCWIRRDEDEPVRLHTGDVVVLPYGDPHTITSSVEGRRPVADASLEQTSLISAELDCDAFVFSPLLRLLPPMLHARSSAGVEASHPTATATRLVEAVGNRHPGSGCRAVCLAELLFMEVLLEHIATLPVEDAGWMRTLDDAAVARALQLLHARPAERWTVDRLARQAGTSRTLLGARFKASLGQPPMHYLAAWRMQIAAGLLRNGIHGVSAVAACVGYDSEAAFNRAFKRLTGMPPARWRTEAMQACREVRAPRAA